MADPRRWIVALAPAALAIALSFWPPIAQDPAYHDFADQRTLLGIPRCFDVLSNVPFAIVGLLGLVVTIRRVDASERWPWCALFAGSILTAFGSAWYHLAPDDARLVWDRLPMTVGFMGLLDAMIAERISARVARWLLAPLLLIGAGSVAWWRWGEMHGAGDLRPYVLVQFGSLLVIVLILLLYRARRGGTHWLIAALAAYVAAKGLEAADARVFALGHVVSGHTLKHLAAGGGVACFVAMLRARASSIAGAAHSTQ